MSDDAEHQDTEAEATSSARNPEDAESTQQGTEEEAEKTKEDAPSNPRKKSKVQ